VRATMLMPVFPQLFEFKGGLFWKAARRPDLTVGMRVRAAHGGTFVFEDLHVTVLRRGFRNIPILKPRR
jgi:hypothetical protein